jgi:hypothetical protein
MSTPKKLSFAKQAAQVLVDWRVWTVVLLYAALCVLIDRLWGPRIFAIAAAPLGIVVALVLKRLDFDSDDGRLSLVKIRNDSLLCALAGVMILQGTEAISRFRLAQFPVGRMVHRFSHAQEGFTSLDGRNIDLPTDFHYTIAY